MTAGIWLGEDGRAALPEGEGGQHEAGGAAAGPLLRPAGHQAVALPHNRQTSSGRRPHIPSFSLGFESR